MNTNLEKQFNLIQHNLVNLVEKKGSFTDPDVLKVSQKLDQLIIHFQRLKLLKFNNQNSLNA